MIDDLFHTTYQKLCTKIDLQHLSACKIFAQDLVEQHKQFITLIEALFDNLQSDESVYFSIEGKQYNLKQPWTTPPRKNYINVLDDKIYYCTAIWWSRTIGVLCIGLLPIILTVLPLSLGYLVFILLIMLAIVSPVCIFVLIPLLINDYLIKTGILPCLSINKYAKLSGPLRDLAQQLKQIALPTFYFKEKGDATVINNKPLVSLEVNEQTGEFHYSIQLSPNKEQFSYNGTMELIEPIDIDDESIRTSPNSTDNTHALDRLEMTSLKMERCKTLFQFFSPKKRLLKSARDNVQMALLTN